MQKILFFQVTGQSHQHATWHLLASLLDEHVACGHIGIDSQSIVKQSERTSDIRTSSMVKQSKWDTPKLQCIQITDWFHWVYDLCKEHFQYASLHQTALIMNPSDFSKSLLSLIHQHPLQLRSANPLHQWTLRNVSRNYTLNSRNSIANRMKNGERENAQNPVNWALRNWSLFIRKHAVYRNRKRTNISCTVSAATNSKWTSRECRVSPNGTTTMICCRAIWRSLSTKRVRRYSTVFRSSTIRNRINRNRETNNLSDRVSLSHSVNSWNPSNRTLPQNEREPTKGQSPPNWRASKSEAFRSRANGIGKSSVTPFPKYLVYAISLCTICRYTMRTRSFYVDL